MKLKLVGTIALSLISSISFAAQIIINDPTYSNSYYESNSSTNTNVYGIGVYETRSDHSFGYHPTGEANIEILGQGDNRSILVLNSYEPTNWNITGAGLDSIDSIYLFGYHDQSVTIGSQSVNIFEYSYEGTQNYVGYAYSWTDPDIAVFENIIGDDIDAFAGSYRATSFTVQAVPLPPAVFLFVSGLLALLGFKNIRRST